LTVKDYENIEDIFLQVVQEKDDLLESNVSKRFMQLFKQKYAWSANLSNITWSTIVRYYDHAQKGTII
jgi:hypothetical protein